MTTDSYGKVKYRRITVDLDILDESELASSLRVLKKYGFNREITIEISPSGKGFHIIAWNNKGVPFDKLLKIREEAGDDPTRIKFDSMPGREINVLFHKKIKRIITFSDFKKELEI